MDTTLMNLLAILGFSSKILILGFAATLPIWGYKAIENLIKGKHKALRVTRNDKNIQFQTTSIIASLGTTTAGVFLIQILPLIFSIIGDLGSEFSIATLYGDHIANNVASDYVSNFYGLTVQLGDMLQTTAPLAAVGLGGYNLMNNLSRGLPA